MFAAEAISLFFSISLKARPETRSVFTSIPLFYRALHTISTQRYRLPVRRYIFDLFDIQLDADAVRGLSAYANTVSSQPAVTQRDKGERPLTMIRTVKRSDGDEDVSYNTVWPSYLSHTRFSFLFKGRAGHRCGARTESYQP